MVKPTAAFSYMKRSLKQQLGSVIGKRPDFVVQPTENPADLFFCVPPFLLQGALRLLADSFEPSELSRKGLGLYYEFRPQSTGWGEKSEVKLAHILSLRRFLTHTAGPSDSIPPSAPVEPVEDGGQHEVSEDDAPPEGGVLIRPPALEASDVGGRDDATVAKASDDDDGRRAKRPKTEEKREADEFDEALDDDIDLSGLG
jgi:hypothetical protein